MTHSPAPWNWDQGDIGHDFSVPYCTVSTEDETIIAEVNDRIGKDIGRANAKLIAASPDMLAAIKEISDIANGSTQISGIMLDSIRRLATTTISKAEDHENT